MQWNPTLLSYEVTSGDVMGMAGIHGVYLVEAAMISPQGQATAADLANFATAGVDVMIAETARV